MKTWLTVAEGAEYSGVSRDTKRRRRISEDEEQRLLDAAPPILRAMIITALDTGMRRGEMLALRFGDIDWADQTITLRGPTTKSGRTTKIPIATLRLRAVLEWLRLDAAGQRKPDSALVFSDGVGEPIRRFRTAWVSTVLEAHGTRPQWSKGGAWKSLTPECQERFRAINLHWHDTRHEYSSRLDERGVPLSQIRDLLGHASIVTTERYDHHTFAALQRAAGRLESGKTSHPLHKQGMRRVQGKPPLRRQKQRKVLNTKNLSAWLGGRDSNPDTVVQSHVSYRWTTSQYPPTRAMKQELLIIANPKADRQHARRLVPGRGDQHPSSFAIICGSPALSGGLPGASPPSCFRRWLAIPPLRPASRASSDVHSCALPF
jgi:site-specific recombinase XerC